MNWEHSGIQTQRQKMVIAAASWLLLAMGIGVFVFTLGLTIRSYSPVPWMDPWYFIYQVDKGYSAPFDLLWSLHNGHRIVIPKLFNLADIYWFHGSGRFLLTSIYTLQVLHFLFLAFLLRRFGRFTQAEFRSVLGVFLLCLFSPAKREDFICGWEIAYVLPMFMATLAFGCFAICKQLHRDSGRAFWFSLAFAAAFIGSFSLTSGFLIWPLLIVEGLLLRLPRKILILTAALGIFAAVSNAIGYSTNVHSSVGELWQARAGVISFFDFLLAEAWNPRAFAIGVTIAWTGLLVMFWRLYRLARHSPVDGELEILLLTIALAATGGAGLTSLGRWSTGFTSRYEEPVSLFWLALGGFVFLFAKQARSPVLVLAAQLSIILLVLLTIPNAVPLLREASYHRQALNLSGAALASGVLDSDALRTLNMPADWTYGELPFLKRHSSALYSEVPGSLAGQSVRKSVTVVPNVCTGSLVSKHLRRSLLWPGVELEGVAWNKLADKAPEWLLITDAKDKIVGFGAADPVLDRRRAGSWKAFIPANSEDQQYRIYGSLSGTSVCALNGLPAIVIPHQVHLSDEPAIHLTPLWTAANGLPRVINGLASRENGVVAIKSDTTDTQAYFDLRTALAQYKTFVIRVKFSKQDTVELFFGQQVNGRGIDAFVSDTNRWLLLHANVGLNLFWKNEAGTVIRFDPTGAAGIGSITEISEIWGSEDQIPAGSDFFEIYPDRSR